MDNEKTVQSWQASIIGKCENILGRELTETEEYFIPLRGGFIALEVIEDTVQSLHGNELEDYLYSEQDEKQA